MNGKPSIRFGHGPKFYVQMKVGFDPRSNIFDEPDHGKSDATVLIETASVDVMPHAVYLFLEQVSHGLYDGTAFYINAAHIVQAGPASRSKFRRYPSLNSVVFQEYAPEMAHKKYTLGYTGRPGGPDFYVNLRDNSREHGPGGQVHHMSDQVADADPCFAKIAKGYEVIERIHRSSVQEGGFHDTMEYPVTILEMKVLEDGFQVPESSDEEQVQLL